MKSKFLFFLLLIFSLNLFSQFTWTRHPGNPVMTGVPGSWDGTALFPGTVLHYDDVYHMWYSAANNTHFSDAVGYATSPDGITWTRYANNPIMVTGAEGEWDSYLVSDCHVVRLDTIFHMWYTGKAVSGQYRIGHATSPDGLTWTKDPDNPVKDITEGFADNYFYFDSPVVYDGNLFHMYYSTGRWYSMTMTVYHAISEDGNNWNLDPENPILTARDNDDYVTPEYIFFNGERYFMSYLRGYDFEWVFNIASSEDLYSWEEYDNNPTFSPGPAGSWDEVIGRANILYDGIDNKYKMWYMGGGSDLSGTSIGYAESLPSGIQNTPTDQIRIFPNPVQDFLTIQTACPDFHHIEITSMNGQLILSKEMDGTNLQIEFSPFQKGVYFLTIRSKDFVITRKIIKL